MIAVSDNRKRFSTGAAKFFIIAAGFFSTTVVGLLFILFSIAEENGVEVSLEGAAALGAIMLLVWLPVSFIVALVLTIVGIVKLVKHREQQPGSVSISSFTGSTVSSSAVRIKSPYKPGMNIVGRSLWALFISIFVFMVFPPLAFVVFVATFVLAIIIVWQQFYSKSKAGRLLGEYAARQSVEGLSKSREDIRLIAIRERQREVEGWVASEIRSRRMNRKFDLALALAGTIVGSVWGLIAGALSMLIIVFFSRIQIRVLSFSG